MPANEATQPGGWTCEACRQAEGVYHVTLTVDVFGPQTTKRKAVQFWLCEACERAARQVLQKDRLQRGRVALRMVDNPGFMTVRGAWNHRE